MTDARWSGEAKYKALLAVAEAANARRDLSSVLDALALALENLVPVDIIGVVHGEGVALRTLAVHFPSDPRRPDESEHEYVQRVAASSGAARRDPASQAMHSALEDERRTIVVDDVRAHPLLGRDEALARVGARHLVMVPLVMSDTFVGGIAFVRARPQSFLPEEVRVLEDVARPVASAVANALAFEEIQSLRARLEDENLALKEEIAAAAATGGIIGSAPTLHAVLERVRLVAATDSTVLITGETGTGKELVARALHNASRRARRALIRVNCAALAEGLVASELFGHEKGAFTGASERRRGRFELAQGGTLFLDEVGELPPAVQVALLRVLQDGEFERVGGSETLRTDARVVAATNRNLQEAVREGRFRADLLFRLDVFPIRMPTLRERTEDVPLLAEYYASHYARRVGKPVRGISPGAMEALCAYGWPGNVRELQNVIERAVILARHEMLEPIDFELPGPRPEAPRPAAREPMGNGAPEKVRIEQALRESRGRVSGADGAAEALGIAPSTLESRIRRLGIDKHAFRSRPRDRRGAAPD
ncbi:MAG: sigma 54-interacting transcriptional regulator [Vicinamibacteria bacterium]|nr:sigma 54-interacting transcriptional regulator [Vicinamibacteria bacterium]